MVTSPAGTSERILDRIDRLLSIGVGLSAEKDATRLLEMILVGAKELTGADGGTLYIVTEDRRLRIEILRTNSLGLKLGGTSGKPIPFEPIPLFLPDGTPNTQMVVSHAALTGEVINIPDAYAAEGFDFSGTRTFDARTGYRSRSFLTVPMKNHEDQIIGVLQLINALNPLTGEVVAFSEADQRLVASLASQASVALTKNTLIQDFKHLFDALIQLLANAVDEKSPYTGGHCRRVPVITMLLADAISRSASGPLADFSLNGKERYELEIAAWLHDCGKVITPEYVVDKATRLETIFDRIHLLDTRFEILKRDAELEVLRERLAALERGEPPATSAGSDLESRLRQLLLDREFLRSCNRPENFMDSGKAARVREVAGRWRWRDSDGSDRLLLSADEIENLTIPAGTLTDLERGIINNHINTTIHMLEALPFPKDLCQVPEFAAGHHEKVNGKGYPRGLTREQMSVQARIMAIADVFEALTARDRPYKRAKTLSETLQIMGQMKLDGSIDPDIFDIFVRDRVYLAYARQYLADEQLDVVDPAAIPGYAGEGGADPA